MRRLVFLVLWLASAPAWAMDLTVTYQTKVGKKSGEKIMYWSDKFQLTVDKSTKKDTLFDADKATVYMIDHQKKQIEFFSLQGMSAMMGQMAPMMNQVMGQKGIGDKFQKGIERSFGSADSAPLEKLGTEQIAGRSCDSYRIKREGKDYSLLQEVCIDSTLIPPGQDTATTAQMTDWGQEIMSGPLGGMVASGSKDLMAMKGLTLKRHNKTATKGMAAMASFGMGKQDSSEIATQVKEGPIDVAVFQLPKNYQMIDQAKMMQDQMNDMQKYMK